MLTHTNLGRNLIEFFPFNVYNLPISKILKLGDGLRRPQQPESLVLR